MTGLALTVAQHYGLAGLRGVETATRALSAAFDRGFAELPELHELLAPASWAAWLKTYPPAVDEDCDDALPLQPRRARKSDGNSQSLTETLRWYGDGDGDGFSDNCDGVDNDSDVDGDGYDLVDVEDCDGVVDSGCDDDVDHDDGVDEDCDDTDGDGLAVAA